MWLAGSLNMSISILWYILTNFLFDNFSEIFNNVLPQETQHICLLHIASHATLLPLSIWLTSILFQHISYLSKHCTNPKRIEFIMAVMFYYPQLSPSHCFLPAPIYLHSSISFPNFSHIQRFLQLLQTLFEAGEPF